MPTSGSRLRALLGVVGYLPYTRPHEHSGGRSDEPEMGIALLVGRAPDGARQSRSGHQRRHHVARSRNLSPVHPGVGGAERAPLSQELVRGPRSRGHRGGGGDLAGRRPRKRRRRPTPVGHVQPVHRADSGRRSRSLADGAARDPGLLARYRRWAPGDGCVGVDTDRRRELRHEGICSC
jgi:hypothetical protein